MQTHRIFTTVAAIAALSALSTPVAGQATACQSLPAVATRDACQKGLDIFVLTVPQVQGALAGGGAVLGSARPVNGLSLGLRINAVDGRLPDLGSIALSSTGIVRSTIATVRVPVPVPTLDVAIGIIPGWSIAGQRLFSLDGLVSVGYVPSESYQGFEVATKRGSLKMGFGGKLGLLDDRLLLPAVSVSFFRRSLPTTSFSVSFAPRFGGTVRDSIVLDETTVQNDAIRLSVSKRLGAIEIGGGIGQDRYRTFTQVRTRITAAGGATSAGIIGVSRQDERNAAYGSLALNVLRLRIGAEFGATFGGDSIATFNTFANDNINTRRLFGSVGVRVRI